MKNDFIKQNNNVVKNRVNGSKMLAFIIIIIVSLSAVLSAVFSGLLLFKDNRKTAYADEVTTNDNTYYKFSTDSFITYLGSALKNQSLFMDFPVNGYSGGIPQDSASTWFNSANYTCMFSFDVEKTSNNYFRLNFYSLSYASANTAPLYLWHGSRFNVVDQETFFSSLNIANFTDSIRYNYSGVSDYIFIENGVSLDFFISAKGTEQLTYGSYVRLNIEKDFNCQVYRVHQFMIIDNSYNILNLVYYDTNDHVLTLRFYTRNTFYNRPVANLFEKWYYTSVLGSADYNTGYNEGYFDGFNAPHPDVYQSGYNAGDTAGYYRGKNDGIAQANDYSFLGLMSAVVDAPVKAFTGLLNFNILGFNMLSFFTGLLTLALILWLVSKVLGNK